MVHFRPRIAVGTFATAGEVEVMIARLRALGITRYERLMLPPDQPSRGLIADGSRQDQPPSAQRDAVSGLPTLRVYLDNSNQEQIVAGALLASAARSVQLHDIEDAGAGEAGRPS